MMKWQALILLLMFVGFGTAAAEVDQPAAISSACSTILSSNAPVNIHEAIVGALRELLIEQVINPQDLATILNGQNPLAYVNTPKTIEFKPIVDHIITVFQSHTRELAPLLKNLLDETTLKSIERNEAQFDTKIKFDRLTFYPIEPGAFLFKQGDFKSRVQIKNEFWFANYQLTQWQYAKVTGDQSPLDVDPTTKLLINPNHPVVGLTSSEVEAFLIKLNRLSKENDPLIYEMIQNHNKFWNYRLSTIKEWRFVARNRGTWLGDFPDGFDGQNLKQIGWYLQNSGGRKHPVGQLEPIMIDGKYPIFDIYGNVDERVGPDRGKILSSLMRVLFGIDKIFFGEPHLAFGFKCGGSYLDNAEHSDTGCGINLFTDRRDYITGLRLVSVPP